MFRFPLTATVKLDILSGGMEARLVNVCQTTACRDARRELQEAYPTGCVRGRCRDAATLRSETVLIFNELQNVAWKRGQKKPAFPRYHLNAI